MAAPLELNRKIFDRELLDPASQPSVAVKLKLKLGRFFSPAPRPPSFRRRRWPAIAVALCLSAFVALRWQLTAGDGAVVELAEGPHPVANVLAGDRLELPGPVEVHLLGIEVIGQCYSGKDFKPVVAADRSVEAIAYTREFVGCGEIRLQFDRTRLDADGHYLAYVWLDDPRGSRLLNEELLRAGLARPAAKSLALCSSPMKRRLTKAAEEFKASGESPSRIIGPSRRHD